MVSVLYLLLFYLQFKDFFTNGQPLSNQNTCKFHIEQLKLCLNKDIQDKDINCSPENKQRIFLNIFDQCMMTVVTSLNK